MFVSRVSSVLVYLLIISKEVDLWRVALSEAETRRTMSGVAAMTPPPSSG